MKQSVKIVVISFALIFFMFVAFGAGVVFARTDWFGTPIVQAQEEELRPPEFEVFWEVWQLAQDNFIDKDALEARQLTYGAITGLIKALGDEGHTRFLTPEEVSAQRESVSGTFFGIGARVGLEDGLPIIVAPFDGSPAEAAGLKTGDIIMEVDGQDVSGLTLNETVDLIRGEKGTEVVLTVFRLDTSESLEIPIIRDEIKIPAASWAIIPGTDVALIRLSQFNGNLDENLEKIVAETEDAGATAFILDIRNNPGGLLEQAIQVTSEFLTDGNVLLQEDAQGNREEYAVRKGGVAQQTPIVVLVNRGSASSSEIFAGAIQDHERGLVVGETTFGTGTVLRLFELSDGSALLLGTSQWLTPDGRLIRKQGIEPDVIVDVPVGTNLISPGELEEMDVNELLESEDAQLLEALELLNALPVADTTAEAKDTVK